MNGTVAAAVDALGAAFLAGDPDVVLEQFATGGEVVYAGSEAGEVAVGRAALGALLEELFERDERYAWEATSVVTASGTDVLYVVAETTLRVHTHRDGVTSARHTEEAPYRITGVLERGDGRWRWRLCQGSEPAQPAAEPLTDVRREVRS